MTTEITVLYNFLQLPRMFRGPFDKVSYDAKNTAVDLSCAVLACSIKGNNAERIALHSMRRHLNCIQSKSMASTVHRRVWEI